MVNEKVLDLANKISRTKRGSKSEITREHPEYKILEPVVTEEMAEVALCLKPKSLTLCPFFCYTIKHLLFL